MVVSTIKHNYSHQINAELNAFIDFHKRNFAYDPLIVWTLDHHCIYASELYLNYVDIDNLTGKELKHINQEYAKFSAEFRPKVTLPMLAEGKPYITFFLLQNRFSSDFGLYNAMIFPLFDSQQQLIAYCVRPQQFRHDAMIAGLMQKFTNFKLEKLKYHKLTEREQMVVFLLIIGLSHKEIATTLSKIYQKGVSLASVSTMISRQINPKFDTHTISVLIQRAILSGYLYNIPHRLVEHLPRIIFVENFANFCQEWGIALNNYKA